eukprot:TRINITY_DN3608_c1_g1_i10.p2 TRINITY_DN3608_c1_g1~~TRINITY_DN3608_c1_g1_i10.p2  ORF type:complete len:104 (+),score=5.97 TRINITY_DN3608_c1_g1_i10:316-627(+)
MVPRCQISVLSDAHRNLCPESPFSSKPIPFPYSQTPPHLIIFPKLVIVLAAFPSLTTGLFLLNTHIFLSLSLSLSLPLELELIYSTSDNLPLRSPSNPAGRIS